MTPIKRNECAEANVTRDKERQRDRKDSIRTETAKHGSEFQPAITFGAYSK